MVFPTRLHCLDVARGFAALSVVLAHWVHFFYVTPGVVSNTFDNESQPFYSILAPFYNHGGLYAIQFFFMLSGFVFFWLYKEKIQERQCSLRSFCLARFSRLYPLHFITLLLVLGMQIVYLNFYSNYFVYAYNDLYHFALQLCLGSFWGLERGHSFNGPIWSVSMEVGFYAMFFLMVFVRKANWQHVAVFILFNALGRKAGLITSRWSASEIFLIGGLTFYAMRFYLNHRLRSRVTDLIAIALPVTIWALMAFSDPFAETVSPHSGLLIRILFPATIISLVLLEIVARVPFRRLKWIGDCSYSLYLLHFPLQLLLMVVVSKFGFGSQDIFYSNWTLWAFFALLISLSLVTYNYCEIPLQKKIRDIGRKWLKDEQVGAGNGDEHRA